MLGAIVGDIVGSVYEWSNIKTKDFPLFREDCFFTDDSVMTCAVAEAIMNGGKEDDGEEYFHIYLLAGTRGKRAAVDDGNVPQCKYEHGQQGT